MNLKEAFRYQKFLSSLLNSAYGSLTSVEHCLKTTKQHLRNAVNPDATDLNEEVEVPEFVANDLIMKFMNHIVEERERLSVAIGEAKSSLGFDLDAAIETNKSRQFVCNAIRQMLRHTPGKRKTQEYGYRFDVNGVQQAYRYDVITTTTENYDKSAAKELMRTLISRSDDVSADVDSAMINTVVEYDPPYDVNESFEDVIEMFISANDQ